MCNTAVRATYDVTPGRFTILNINRMNPIGGQPLIRTPLSIARSDGIGVELIGEMIACVSHIGNHQGGHWTCFTHATDWYLNNDSNQIVRIPGHPFDVIARNPMQTADLITFKNA